MTMTHTEGEHVPSPETMAEWASYYTAIGWEIFPCQGKKPRSQHGFYDATTAPSRVTQWWKQWPDADIGAPTGHKFWVLDVDPRNGGDETLSNLTHRHGQLPDTLQCLTPNGGTHYYFTIPDAGVTHHINIGPGIDVQARGGYVILPPSRNPDAGRGYTWEGAVLPGEYPILPTPPWLIMLVARRATHAQPPGDGGEPILEGMRHTTLVRIAGSMRRHGSTPEEILTALASINRRCVPPFPDKDLQRIARSMGRYRPAPPQDEGPRGSAETSAAEEDARGEKPDPAHQEAGFHYNSKGVMRKTPHNLMRILATHPAWHGVLGYNQLLGTEVLMARPPWETGDGIWKARPMTDADFVWCNAWISQTYDADFPLAMVPPCLAATAHQVPFHPIREYLTRLEWDGETRIGTWLTTYCAAEETPYTRAVGCAVLVSAVARAMAPGCQADSVAIFEGEQGIGKSSAWRILAGQEWFSDTMPDIHSKDAMQSLRGKWIIELGELAWVGRSEMEAVKRFISTREDYYRPPYGKAMVSQPRSVIFVGTTNEARYLKDTTGNRRFFPVRLLGSIDIEALSRDREHLWAEAVQAYQRGATWVLPPELLDTVVQEQESRVEEDPWVGMLAEKLLAGVHYTTTDILSTHLDMEIAKQGRPEARRLGQVMRMLGWEQGASRQEGGVQRMWKKRRDAS